ncbi:prepilin-type N-terminal cleavage/methylation domain-containing protein [Desulfobaculum sp.]|jgi:prepilin-type N-terminal cleavage/methylation domain-containing protein
MPHASRAGFSLLEVLIALMVAAVLAVGLMSAQGHIVHLAERGRGIWDNLNMTTRLMAEDYPDRLTTPSAGFVPDSEQPGGEWQLERTGSIDGLGRYALTTKVPDATLRWEWLRNERIAGSGP